MKCFCHTTNIAAVLGNAPSLLDVAWWNRGHGKNGAGWNQTPLDYWSLHRCDVAESGQAAQGEGYYELLFWWCSKKLPTVEMIRAECQSTFCQSKNKTCMLRHSPPFPTTLLFKHIHARRRAYLNPWSVNSAFVGFHCGAYLWSEGGMCASKSVCLGWNDIPSHKWINSRAHHDSKPRPDQMYRGTDARPPGVSNIGLCHFSTFTFSADLNNGLHMLCAQ